MNCVSAEGIWEISVVPFQFCCKPEAVLKHKVFKKQNKTRAKALVASGGYRNAAEMGGVGQEHRAHHSPDFEFSQGGKPLGPAEYFLPWG